MRAERGAHVLRGLCLALLIAIAALRVGTASLGPWITLVGVPLLIALVAPGPTLLPRARPLALFLFASLALGLLATEPWRDLTGSLLLGGLALAGVVAVVHDTGRAALVPGLPRPARPVRRRAFASALLVALLVVLTAIGIDALLAPVPGLWKDTPPKTPRVDRLADQVQPPAAPSPEPADVGERALALVRVVDDEAGGADGEEEPLPAELHLRSRVLEEQVDNDGFVFLAAHAGTSALIRDGDDGREDQRIHWPEARDADGLPRITFQVTLLSDALDALLVVPAPRWIEGRSLALASDGSLARPSSMGSSGGTFTYRTSGSPQSAFLPQRDGECVAAHDRERTRLPEAFDGRHALEQVVSAALVAPQDDLAKARALANHLRATGHLDPGAPFRNWSEFLAARAGSSLHFAQCFALAARLAELPARVAVGYRTARFDPKERRFEVRGSDVHYWAEVEFDELGWVAFDPCPEPAEVVSEPIAPLDVAPEQTDAKAMRTAFASKRPLVVGLLLILLLAAFFAFPTLRLELEKRMGARPPQGLPGSARRAWRYWQELLDCCRRFGLDSHPAHTAEEFARVVGSAVPAEVGGVLRLLRVYHACRFGGAELVAEEERASKELLGRLPASLESWRGRTAGTARNRR